MRIMDLGCGSKKVKGKNILGLDKKLTPDVQIICDVEKSYLPFKNNSFDKIFAIHFLEHLNDPFNVVKEIHRVLKKNGKLIIHVPFFTSAAAHDTDHKRFFNYSSFEYFTGDKINYPEYEKYKFKINSRKIVLSFGKLDKLLFPITVFFNFFINISPKFFQNSFLAYLIQPCFLHFELQAIK